MEKYVTMSHNILDYRRKGHEKAVFALKKAFAAKKYSQRRKRP
jgi:hypothetical protein